MIIQWIPVSTKKLKDGPCLFQTPYINVHLSIYQFINISMDEKNGRGDISVGQQTEVRIFWPIHQWICVDTYLLTQVHRRAVSISNPRNQYSPINKLIYKLIDISTARENGQIYTSVGNQTEVLIYQPIYQQRHRRHIDWLMQQQLDSCAPLNHVRSIWSLLLTNARWLVTQFMLETFM